MGRTMRILSMVYLFIKSLPRYKGTLFWVVMFPVLFYGLMVAIWGGNSFHPLDAGIVNGDTNNVNNSISYALIAAMNSSNIFNVHIYNSTDKLVEDLKHGVIDIGLYIPKGFSENITTMKTGEIHVFYLKESGWGDYNKQVAKGFLDTFSNRLRSMFLNESAKYAAGNVPSNLTEFLEQWFSFIDRPILLEEHPYNPKILSTPQGIRAFYAIGMIGVQILFIGLSIGVTSLIEMKKDGTLSMVLSKPMKSSDLFLSLTLESLLAVGISSLAIFIVSKILGAEYYMNIVTASTTILLLIIGTLFTIGLGLLLAVFARTEEAAMVIVNAIAFPVMFIGGLVIPEFVLPEYVKVFAQYYPLSQTIQAIRKMLIYESPAPDAVYYSLPAFIGTVIVYTIGFLVFNRLVAKNIEE